MARIRTLKPDAFRSRTMKKLSFRARWTFWGLLVQVDDKGRARDDVDLIRADIYPLEMDEVSVKDVETDIAELVIADMVCRYRVDRDEYLHIINFAKHQRINRPSESQLPQCPHHSDGDSPSGRSTAPEPPFSEPSGSPHAPLSEPSGSPQPSRVRAGSGSGSGREVEREEEEEGAPPPGLAHPEALFEFAAAPPAEDSEVVDAEPDFNAGTLVGEWLESRPDNRPPGRVIGHAGKELRILLEEDRIPYETVRAGFMAWSRKGCAPSAIASFVNDVQAADVHGAGSDTRPSTTTRIVNQGVDLIRKMAAEDGVEIADVLPFARRAELTA